MQISKDMYNSDPQYFRELANRLGYYFRIKTAEYPTQAKKDKLLRLILTFLNEGVTPFCGDAVLYAAIFDKNGQALQVKKTSINPQKWKPGQEYTEFISLDCRNVPSGEYTLAVGLLNENEDLLPDYLFGNTGNMGNGWYAIGNCRLSER